LHYQLHWLFYWALVINKFAEKNTQL